MVLIRKNNTVSHLNEISIYKTLVKTLMCILIKKLISYCLKFETNILIKMFIDVAVDCKSDSRQENA